MIPTWEEAAQRVRYCLTYGRCEPRPFFPAEMGGPDIPCAYDADRMSPGEWYGDAFDFDEEDHELTPEHWFAGFASKAIGEAVHEALEFFWVDGRPWLDPHGEHEAVIHDEVHALCRRLALLVTPDLLEETR